MKQRILRLSVSRECFLLIMTGLCWFRVRAKATVSEALFEELFSTEYRTELPPMCYKGDVVNITLDIMLRQIIHLEAKQQILSANFWVRQRKGSILWRQYPLEAPETQQMKWIDCRLSWDPARHQGIEKLVVPYRRVWTPDLFLYDSSEEDEMMPGRDQYRPQILSSGIVIYNFPTVFRSICRVKVTYFPFDVQICNLMFGSWSHSMNDLDIYPKASKGYMDDFVPNNEWSVVSLTSRRNTTVYGTEIYPDVTYLLVLRRSAEFYIMTMIFPCFLISTIATIGFLLPSESGEKISLEVTVLLSLAVFLLLISEFLPPSAEDIPLIGIYFAVSMLMVSISLCLQVIVLNIHHHGKKGKRLPKTLRKLLRLKSTTPKQSLLEVSSADEIKSNGIPHFTMENTAAAQSPSDFSNSRQASDCLNYPNDGDTEKTLRPYTEVLQAAISEQTDILRRISAYTDIKHREHEKCEEWKALARLIDRILMAVYSVLSFAITVVFTLVLKTYEE